VNKITAKEDRCCGTTFDGWRNHPCSAKGKIERDGKKYCKRHDPVNVLEKMKKRQEKYDAENKLWKKEYERKLLMDSLLKITEKYAEENEDSHIHQISRQLLQEAKIRITNNYPNS
jgi:hypothetical protein